MANPTPAFYLFRVQQIKPSSGNASLPSPNEIGDYIPQYSADSNVTWNNCFARPFQSLVEATQAIVKLVNNEQSFRDKITAGQLVPVVTYVAYP